MVLRPSVNFHILVSTTICSHDFIPHAGLRAVLTLVGSGGFDPISGVMVYYYPYNNNDELESPLPAVPVLCNTQPTQQHPLCSKYYLQGLYRQHTNSSAFHDFSPISGKAFLVSSPGYYVGCVSASGRDASSVWQDGVVSVMYVKKDTKDAAQCPSGHDSVTPTASHSETAHPEATQNFTHTPSSHSETTHPETTHPPIPGHDL